MSAISSWLPVPRWIGWMLCRKSEIRATRSVVGPAAAEGAADAAADAAADGAAADGGAADAGAADGDVVAPPQATAINVIAARTAGKRAFIDLLLSRLPCTGNAQASCNPTAPVSTYYSSNETMAGECAASRARPGHSGGI